MVEQKKRWNVNDEEETMVGWNMEQKNVMMDEKKLAVPSLFSGSN